MRAADPEAAVHALLAAGATRGEVVAALEDLKSRVRHVPKRQAYSRMQQVVRVSPSRPYAEPAVRVNPLARENFFGLFKSKPPPPTFDLAEHVRLAADLSGQVERVRDYLVHAPGRGGKGKAWYWVGGLGLQAFTRAKGSGFPRRYIEAVSPWAYVKMNLGSYRDGATRPFVIIDTFQKTVEGPVTKGEIEARKNPRHLVARRNRSRRRLGAMADKAELLLRQLQGIKAGAQLAHWNATGPQGYSDHLLYERIYTAMDDLVDTLAEKYVSYFETPVPASAVVPLLDEPLSVAALVAEARNTSDVLRHKATMSYDMETLQVTPAGLDDYLMSLNNKLDTFYYLLANVRGDR